MKQMGWNKKSNENNDKYIENESLIRSLYSRKIQLQEYVNSLDFIDINKTQEGIDLKYINSEITTEKNKLLKMIKSNMNLVREVTRRFSPKDVIASFDCSLFRIIGAKPDTFTDDLIVVRVYHYDIFECLVRNVFMCNGNKYVFWSASAGQLRVKKCVFIKEETLQKYYNTMYCGLTLDRINRPRVKIVDGEEVVEQGCNVNKYISYTSLISTGSEKWEDFDIDRTIVVDDFESIVNGLVDYINYEEYDENGLWIIERKKMNISIPVMDGCGLSLDYTGMFRIPWGKGLLVKFPFVLFIREKRAEYRKKGLIEEAKRIGIVKDIYGKEHDIIKENIKYIFTKSQFKMWKYYDSWDEYKENFKKYNCEACKGNSDYTKYRKSKISYQPLQSLYDLTKEEILSILSETNYDIENIGKDRNHILKVLGATKSNDKKNYFQEALLTYPELLNDVYSKRILQETKESMVNHARYGKVVVDGTYVFVLPDVYAFAEWLFLGEENPKGLLNDGEVSCKLIENDIEVDMVRSPHLNFSHCINKNVLNEDTKKWYKSNSVYTSSHSLYSLELMSDWDGDIVLLIKDKTIITHRTKKYGQHGLAIVKDKENDFAGWINYKFRGVATKYLQSYIMWYVVKHKYLLSRVVDDIGRMLNLAASDWEAWYVYMRLRLKHREKLT